MVEWRLRAVVGVCATAFTIANILVNGDGIATTALFTLYGVLIGEAVNNVRRRNNDKAPETDD